MDKKHWTHLETVPFRGASNIKIIISSIILLNRLWIIIRKAKIETIILSKVTKIENIIIDIGKNNLSLLSIHYIVSILYHIKIQKRRFTIYKETTYICIIELTLK